MPDIQCRSGGEHHLHLPPAWEATQELYLYCKNAAGLNQQSPNLDVPSFAAPFELHLNDVLHLHDCGGGHVAICCSLSHT